MSKIRVSHLTCCTVHYLHQLDDSKDELAQKSLDQCVLTFGPVRKIGDFILALGADRLVRSALRLRHAP